MAVLLLVGTVGFSQEKQETGKRVPKTELTTEQKNDLRLKEMTLKLDLTASQQKEMAKIIADQQKSRSELQAKMKEKRDSNTKPTSEEVYAMRSKKLDSQIENRAKMKKMLTPEQFATWEKFREERPHRMNKDFGKRHKKTAQVQQQNQK